MGQFAPKESVDKQSSYRRCWNWVKKSIVNVIASSSPVIVRYKILNDDLKLNASYKYKQDCKLGPIEWKKEKNNEKLHKKIWSLVKAIINKEYRKKIDSFVIFSVREGCNTVAYVRGKEPFCLAVEPVNYFV
ncbi:hypothetical protein [Cardinium endosymbiont of Nabis limbatus]|uniref:hypothetical protein n=1 Tax=Cardinium endosymbiont of Nabis limbatus TaxID=3066217 RepID=UPI003AF39222